MDPSLVERARSGDHDAFTRLVAGAGDRLHALALRILRDAEAAGDVFQASLVDIWRDLPTLRDPERFEAWASRIIVNRCRAELRRARRRPPTIGLQPADWIVGDVQLAVGIRDVLDRAFARLSVDHRAVLVLLYYRGLSVPEAAAVLGVSEGTVKSRLHYGRRAMRAAIEADERLAARRQERPA